MPETKSATGQTYRLLFCVASSQKKSKQNMQQRERESVCACVCVLDKVGDRVFTSRALGIVFVALSVSDWFQ